MAVATPMIEPLAAADLPALSLVAVASYVQAYSDLWADPARLSQRLQRFAPEALRAWTADPATRVWTAKAGGAVVGYLRLRLRSPDPVEADPAAAEVHRVYLLAQATGRGLGRALMERAEAEARREATSALWLKSMAQGPARAAYARMGYREIGADALDNDIPERSPMVVLQKSLHP
jgi:diamine N-acetyltransferase